MKVKDSQMLGLAVISGDSGSDEQEEDKVAAESIEQDLELRLHMMGNKMLYTQTLSFKVE